MLAGYGRDPGGIRAGSAGDPQGIRMYFGGIRGREGRKCVGVERDPPTPSLPFIILKKGNRRLAGQGPRPGRVVLEFCGKLPSSRILPAPRNAS